MEFSVKLDTREIQGLKKIEITGDEPWLDHLYGYFRSEKNDSPSKLTGEFELSYNSDLNAYRVCFKFDYTPRVDCSRCGIKIDWPIFKKGEIYFHCDDDLSSKSDIVDLEQRDLDAYYVEDGKIDLGSILNEAVHLEIPTQTVPASKENPNDCASCGLDISGDQVFGTSKEDDPTNPFAALKSLKKPN